MTKPTPAKPYHHGDVAAAAVIAAGRIVEEAGAAALTLRAVAAEVGVSHAALYRHFATRDDLVDAVAAAWLDALVDAGSDGDDLPAYARRYVATALASPRAYACVFEAAARPASHRTADALARFRRQAASVYRESTGAERDELRDGVLRLWGTLHGMVDLYWRGLIRARSTGAAVDYIVGSVLRSMEV